MGAIAALASAAIVAALALAFGAAPSRAAAAPRAAKSCYAVERGRIHVRLEACRLTRLETVQATQDDRITVCHATGSATNPYVQITVSEAGVLDGHAKGSHQDDRDIIPPFAGFPGQNWDANGAAIYRNGCGAAASFAIPGGSVGLLGLAAILMLGLGLTQIARPLTVRLGRR